MLESGFTSCEDELLENVTTSLVSSIYTDDGNNTWKSSSGSTADSLTKVEDIESPTSPRKYLESPTNSRKYRESPTNSRKYLESPTSPKKYSPPSHRKYDFGSPPKDLNFLSPSTDKKPPFSTRKSQIPVVYHSQPSQSKFLTKCQSLQDLSKCMALTSIQHGDKLHHTFNSTDTINSQSLTSSTKDSGFQRSYSSNSLCSVNRRHNKYDHVESKVKQYIRNIKENERKHKVMKEIKRNSLNVTDEGLGTAANSRRSSLHVGDDLHDLTLYAEEPGDRRLKFCDTTTPALNKSSASYREELRNLFNIESDKHNKTLAQLIQKLELEKYERDVLIENLQSKYHELNHKLSSANETINDLKQQVLTPTPLARSKSTPSAYHNLCHERSAYDLKKRLSPVPSVSSQASNRPSKQASPSCCSRSSQNSAKLKTKLNLPREDPFVKVKRWQDSIESSDSTSVVTSSPIKKSATLSYLPVSPIRASDPVSNLSQNQTLVSTTLQSVYDLNRSKTNYLPFDQPTLTVSHLGQSKTTPDMKRSTMLINIGDCSTGSSSRIMSAPTSKVTVLDVNSNLCQKEPLSPLKSPKKQISVLNIFEGPDGSKCTKVMEPSSSCSTGMSTAHAVTKAQLDQSQESSNFEDSGIRSNYSLCQSRTTPSMKSSRSSSKRVSINLTVPLKSSTESMSDSWDTTTDDEPTTRRPPSVPPNTRLFRELTSLKSCLNEVDEQIHVLKSGIDNLIKSSSQKSVHSLLME